VRYLTNVIPWPYPPDGAEKFIRESALPAGERGEAWHWTLRLRTDPETLIGAINLRVGEDNNRGFWIAPSWQGNGLMTEAADAVTAYWFEVLKFPVLRVPKAIANEASRRISLRQGMRVVAVEERDYVGGRFLSEVWEITRQEWQVRTALTSDDI
jgi:RimJ/RimL family protein N-acetyltransferase